ncbi:MAG: thioredoxin family protein [Rhodospirillales bacterium]|nr:thioredoxin family protein [Rhodospirillales bacterium]
MSAMRFMRLSAVPLLAVLALGAIAGGARAAAGSWDQQAKGAARLLAATEATGSAETVDAAIQIRLPKGWHTYWQTPGDAGIPPTVSWKGSRNLRSARVEFPVPTRLPAVAGLLTLGYDNGVVLPVAVTLEHPGQPLHLHAQLDYASCQAVCVPIHADLVLDLPAGLATPGRHAALIAAAQARVPVAAAGIRVARAVVSPATDGKGALVSLRLVSTAGFIAPDLFLDGAGSPVPPRIAVTASGHTALVRLPAPGAKVAALAGRKLRFTLVDGARVAALGATVGAGAPLAMPGGTSLAAILAIAFAGGLVLNLMPCVLPVISLKLMALLRYAGAERRAARASMLASAAGIVASFLAMSVALAGLRAAGTAIGWGIQFQSPWFLAAMALATTLFAAGLFGVLEFGALSTSGPPSASAGGHWGAFLTGAFATILASSCTAPFVGTALGFAFTRGAVVIVAVLGTMGLGMAAPFLAAAAAPGIVAFLPRPGRWMLWMRRFFGVGLLATSAWLLWVLSFEAGMRAALLAAAALGVLLALLAWRPRFATIGALVAALLALAAPALYRPVAAGTTAWRRFNPQAIPALVATNKTVFVNVTAAWCLTCKANEIAVLDQAPVAGMLRETGIVAMQADWTRPDPVIAAFLAHFRRFGVPLDVVYGPGAPQGIALPELLTSGAVVDALRRAAARQEAAR